MQHFDAMLAQTWRAARRRQSYRGQRERQGSGQHGTDAPLRRSRERCPRVCGVDDLVDASDSIGTDANRSQAIFDFLAGILLCPSRNRLIDLVVVLQPIGCCTKAPVWSPVLLADQPCQCIPLVICLGAQRAPVIGSGAGIDSLWSTAIRSIAAAAWNGAVDGAA